MYTTREALTAGQSVRINGDVLTVVTVLGLDHAGRHGIEWSNGVVEFAPVGRRLLLADDDVPTDDDESMYETDDDDDTLVELNAQVIPDHPLAWSWYYDMIEELNAQSVSGGEWSYCWR